MAEERRNRGTLRKVLYLAATCIALGGLFSGVKGGGVAFGMLAGALLFGGIGGTAFVLACLTN